MRMVAYARVSEASSLRMCPRHESDMRVCEEVLLFSCFFLLTKGSMLY